MASFQERFASVRAPSELKAERGEAYDRYIKEIILKTIKATPDQIMAFGDESQSTPNNPLDVLDPTLDTLPYISSLFAQIQAVLGKSKGLPATLRPGGDLFVRLVDFLRRFDAVEIRYAGTEWRKLVELLASVARSMSEANLDSHPVLSTISTAMLRLDPSAGTFTSTHVLFVQLCMEIHAFEEARVILDKSIHSIAINSHANNIDLPYPCSDAALSNGYIVPRLGFSEKVTLDMLQDYYAIGALAYIGLKDWINASYFLEHVMAVPTNNSANGIMVEAYKRWTLVELLARNRCSLQPKLANPWAIRNIRNLSKAYEGVVEAFKLQDPQKLNAEVFEAQAVWTEDANAGLIQHVVDHHKRLFVTKTQKIYAALPMTEVASMLGTDASSAEAYISQLISDGSLKARIEASTTKSTKIIRFAQSPRSESTAATELALRNELLSQTQRIEDLASHVAEADKRLGMTKEYIDHVRKLRKTPDDPVALDEDGMDLPMSGPAAGASSEDENVMSG